MSHLSEAEAVPPGEDHRSPVYVTLRPCGVVASTTTVGYSASEVSMDFDANGDLVGIEVVCAHSVSLDGITIMAHHEE